jgi:hypothetical protein
VDFFFRAVVTGPILLHLLPEYMVWVADGDGGLGFMPTGASHSPVGPASSSSSDTLKSSRRASKVTSAGVGGTGEIGKLFTAGRTYGTVGAAALAVFVLSIMLNL